MTARTPREAIALAIATIERLAPGSAQGTLHVLLDTLASLGPPTPEPEPLATAYWVIIADQHGDVLERRKIGIHEHLDCQAFAGEYAEQAECTAVTAPAGTGEICVYISNDADMVPRVKVNCFTSAEFFLRPT